MNTPKPLRTRRAFAALAPALLVFSLQPAPAAASPQPFDLITPAEARAEAEAVARAPGIVVPRSQPVPRREQPAIQVLQPATPTAGVPAPVRIELAFKPAPGTRIVPSSFRVLYGLLKLDLTERLSRNATVSETGVVVEQARVPEGQHRLILQIADDQGNTAEHELRLRVGVAS